MNTPSDVDAKMLQKTLGILMPPGAVVELRVPKADKFKTISGYFDNPAALIKSVADLNGAGASKYITLNPVNPALLARAHNRVIKYAAKFCCTLFSGN